ncbi:MAG TPA: hypothetical protein VF085_05300 [Solirubrobacterales bacterium]
MEIIDLHPDHLTEQELTLRIGADQEDFAEVEAIKGAIRSLGSSGLVRRIGEVIAPTHAALRAATIFNQFP